MQPKKPKQTKNKQKIPKINPKTYQKTKTTTKPNKNTNKQNPKKNQPTKELCWYLIELKSVELLTCFSTLENDSLIEIEPVMEKKAR